MRRRRSVRKHLGHREDTHRWLVSYADYMTLMFALFVMLYAMAIVNKERYPVLMEHLHQVVEKLTQQQLRPQDHRILPYPDSAPNIGEGQQAIAPEHPGNSPQSPLANAESTAEVPANAAAQNVLSPVQERLQGEPLSEVEKQLNQQMAGLLAEHQVTLSRDDQWLLIELNSELLFASGSATLLNPAKALLAPLAQLFNQTHNYLRVRGYTDDEPIHNELYESNWELSVTRALHVLRYLTQQGVAPQRLAVEGYGQYSPQVPNTSEEHRIINRRVVIAISRYAWKAPQPPELSVDEPTQKTQVREPRADSETILTVPLQGGGVRYTTRQDEQ